MPSVLGPALCAHAAWIEAIELLLQSGDQDNLLVEFTPGCTVHSPFEEQWDRALPPSTGFARLETVRNTIFPSNIAATSGTRAQLFERYSAIYPRVLRHNPRGTYFGRMMGYDRARDLAAGTNQLENVIREMGRNKGLCHASEVTLVVPEKDTRPMGFPCLSHLSFHRAADNQVRLTAIYRNHYFIQRALGNYLALADLLRFISREAGRVPGNVSVLSAHATIERRGLAASAVGIWRNS
jgi:hypothetical protein